MSNTEDTVKEVVLFKVKPEYISNYSEKVAPSLQTFLKNQKGFLHHQSLSAIKQKGYMIDLVEWETLNDAEAASAEWKKRAESGEFSEMTSAFDKVEFFDHFKPTL